MHTPSLHFISKSNTYKIYYQDIKIPLYYTIQQFLHTINYTDNSILESNNTDSIISLLSYHNINIVDTNNNIVDTINVVIDKNNKNRFLKYKNFKPHIIPRNTPHKINIFVYLFSYNCVRCSIDGLPRVKRNMFMSLDELIVSLFGDDESRDFKYEFLTQLKTVLKGGNYYLDDVVPVKYIRVNGIEYELDFTFSLFGCI